MTAGAFVAPLFAEQQTTLAAPSDPGPNAIAVSLNVNGTTHELRLDPTYERESKTRKPAHVEIYDALTQYRNARLIEFLGAEYLYHAAMKSKSCRLTPHGRHYWQLAEKGLL